MSSTNTTTAKILVIEDQTVMRENLVTLLELEGYQVSSAADGSSGVHLALTGCPDLVLCDVMMPGMDGYNVLQQLRTQRHGARIPFLFLTAKGERADIRTGMNLGADDYLVKPIAQQELLDAISARLERQRVLDMQQTRTLHFTSPKPLENLGLTPREAEVLFWVAQGKGNRDIGLLLEMSEATVKRHLLSIFQKLGVETRTAAALKAIEQISNVG